MVSIPAKETVSMRTVHGEACGLSTLQQLLILDRDFDVEFFSHASYKASAMAMLAGSSTTLVQTERSSPVDKF